MVSLPSSKVGVESAAVLLFCRSVPFSTTKSFKNGKRYNRLEVLSGKLVSLLEIGLHHILAWALSVYTRALVRCEGFVRSTELEWWFCIAMYIIQQFASRIRDAVVKSFLNVVITAVWGLSSSSTVFVHVFITPFVIQYWNYFKRYYRLMYEKIYK